MKIYTIYSATHENLYKNYFLESLKLNCSEDRFQVVATEVSQDCPAGTFYSPGWRLAMSRKFDVYLEAVKQNFGQIFIWADVDIYFLKSFKKNFVRRAWTRRHRFSNRNKWTILCRIFCVQS